MYPKEAQMLRSEPKLPRTAAEICTKRAHTHTEFRRPVPQPSTNVATVQLTISTLGMKSRTRNPKLQSLYTIIKP